MAKLKTPKFLAPEIKVHPITGCRVDTLFGVWLYEDTHLHSLVNTAWGYVERGELQALADANAQSSPENGEEQKPYQVDEHGLAHLMLSGPITKMKTSFQSVFGGIATMELRNTCEMLANDSSVRGVMVQADSWGGTNEGTPEGAAAIARLNEKKPVFVHAEDKATSAMLWLATQGTRFTAGPSACIGSMGTMLVVNDTSERAKELGIKPVVIKAGKHKAIGVPGTPVTPEQEAELQRHVNLVNDSFAEQVLSSRRLDAKKDKDKIEEIKTARVFIGQDAKRVGLIDDVCTTAQAIEFAIANLGSGSGRTQRGFTSGQGKMDMLTQEQLTKASSLGLKTLSADSTVDDVLNAVTGFQTGAQQKISSLEGQVTALQAKAAPAPISPKLAKQTATIFAKEVDLLAKAGTVTANQANLLKNAVMNDKGDALDGVVNSDGELMFTASSVVNVLEGGVKNEDLAKPKTGAQPAIRTEPGKQEEESKQEEKVSITRQNQIREQAGLELLPAEIK